MKVYYGLMAGMLLIGSFGAQAANETRTYLIDGKKLSFHRDEEKRITISSDCKKDGKGQFSCQAYQALSKASLKPAKSQDLAGGVNPGAYVCQAVVKGAIVYATDEKKNEQTFCEFKDGSRVSNGSLHYAAMQNDEKKK